MMTKLDVLRKGSVEQIAYLFETITDNTILCNDVSDLLGISSYCDDYCPYKKECSKALSLGTGAPCDDRNIQKEVHVHMVTIFLDEGFVPE